MRCDAHGRLVNLSGVQRKVTDRREARSETTYHKMMLSREKNAFRADSSQPALHCSSTRNSRSSVLQHSRGK